MINILVSNGRGYIWDIADMRQLRVEHHICGVLTGTLPQVGQQNLFLGFPLALIPEEVVLLVNLGVAVIVDDPKAHQTPTEEEVKEFERLRDETIQTQRMEIAIFDQDKKKQMELLYKDVIGKKRIEKKAKGKQSLNSNNSTIIDDSTASTSKVEIFDTSDDTPTSNPTASTSTLVDPFSPEKLSSIPYQIIIQPSSTTLPWHRPSSPSVSYPTIDSAKVAGIWNYPSTELQSSRCKIFQDLWSKGFYMGGGLRFGGDFLIYPGDPLRFHSHFTITILANISTPMMPLDLVAYGRLATAVKKAHLLGSWNEQTSKAEYISLEWAAFG